MGGGGKGGKAAPPPDPYKTAAAQGQANKDAAIATAQINMVDQAGPYGTVKYNQLPGSGQQYNQGAYDKALAAWNAQPTTSTQLDVHGRPIGTSSADRGAMPKLEDFKAAGGDVPRYEQTTTLDPSQQRQLDLNNQLSENALNTGLGLWQNITNATSNPFKISDQPPLPTDYSADRDRVEGELYNRSLSRLEPQFQKDTNSLENKLVNQGLTRGSEAFTDAMQQNQYGQTDARNSALQNAIATAGNEQSRLFGLAMQGRQQGIQEQALERSQPINEVSTLLGLGGSVTPPQFSSPGQVAIQPGDVQGSVWNAYNAQQAQQAQRNQGAGNLFGLAGTLGSAAINAGMFSDIRLKEHIKAVGKLDNGLTVYSYNYIGNAVPHIGLMAHEVEEIHPEAVYEVEGYKAVNYAEAVK